MITNLDEYGCAQGLRRTLGSAPLNINEVRAVLRLLRYICQHKDPQLLALLRSAGAADAVPVPAADSRLVSASACVHTLTCPPHLLSRFDRIHLKDMEIVMPRMVYLHKR